MLAFGGAIAEAAGACAWELERDDHCPPAMRDSVMRVGAALQGVLSARELPEGAMLDRRVIRAALREEHLRQSRAWRATGGPVASSHTLHTAAGLLVPTLRRRTPLVIEDGPWWRLRRRPEGTGYVILDLKDRYTYVSPQAADLLGYRDPLALAGKRPVDLMAKDSEVYVYGIERQQPLHGRRIPASCTYDMVRGDGRVTVVEALEWRPMLDGMDQVAGHRAFLHAA